MAQAELTARQRTAREKKAQVGRIKDALMTQAYMERRVANGGIDYIDELIMQTARLSPGMASKDPYGFARSVAGRLIAYQAARASKG